MSKSEAALALVGHKALKDEKSGAQKNRNPKALKQIMKEQIKDFDCKDFLNFLREFVSSDRWEGKEYIALRETREYVEFFLKSQKK